MMKKIFSPSFVALLVVLGLGTFGVVKAAPTICQVFNGCTGKATLTPHGVLVGNGTNPLNVTTAGNAGDILTSNGASADPTFQTLSVSASSQFNSILNVIAPTNTAASLAVGGTNSSAPFYVTGGGALTVLSTSTLATTTASMVNGTIVVDGVHYPKTDTGINNALTDCAANSCSTVHVPSGTFLITTNVVIPTSGNMVFEGEGPGTHFILSSGAGIVASSTSNVEIRGFNIDASSLAQGNKAILVRNASNITVDHNSVINSLGFAVFTDSRSNETTQRIWIENNDLRGLGASDVVGGGPENSTGGVVKEVYVDHNFIQQDRSVNHAGAAINFVKVNRISFTNNTVYGDILFGVEQWPSINSTISNNIVNAAIGATCSAVGSVAVVSSTESYNNLDISHNVLFNSYIDIFSNSTSLPTTNINVNGNTINASGCTEGILVVNVTGGNFENNLIASSTNIGIHIKGGRNLLVANNTVTGSTNEAIKSESSSRTSDTNSYFGNALYNNGSDYSLSESTKTTWQTYDNANIQGSALVTSVTGNYIGSASSTNTTAGATLYVSRSSGEGTPTLQSGTVAQFASNQSSGFSAAIGIVSGTQGNATLNFGNYLDDSAGHILFKNSNSTFSTDKRWGFATSSPQYIIDAYAESGPAIRIDGGTHSGQIQINGGDSTFKIVSAGSGDATNYIESGNVDFTGSNPLVISGYNNNIGPNLSLKFSNIAMAGNATTSGFLVVGTANPTINMLAGDFLAARATTTNLAVTTIPSCSGSSALQTGSSGQLQCGAISVAASGSAGAWQTIGTNILTPTSTGAGIVVNAASSTITVLHVNSVDAATAFLPATAGGATLGTNGLGFSSLWLDDTSSVYELAIQSASGMAGDQTLTIDVGNYSPTLTFSPAQGNPTLGDWFDQNVKITGSPTFAKLIVSGNATTSSLVVGTANPTINMVPGDFWANRATTTNLTVTTLNFNGADITNIAGTGLSVISNALTVTAGQNYSPFNAYADPSGISQLLAPTSTSASLAIGGTTQSGAKFYVDGATGNASTTGYLVIGTGQPTGSNSAAGDLWVGNNATTSNSMAAKKFVFNSTMAKEINEDVISSLVSGEIDLQARGSIVAYLDTNNNGSNNFTILANGVTTVFNVNEAGNATTSGYLVVGTTNPTSNMTAGQTLFGGHSTTTGHVFMSGLEAEAAQQGSLCINLTSFEVLTNNAVSCLLSSLRYKHDINDLSLEEAQKIVTALRSVKYLENGSNTPGYGFIAEEVDKALTSLNLDPHLLVSYDAEGKPLTVKYEQYTAVLTKVLQSSTQGSQSPQPSTPWYKDMRYYWPVLFLGFLIKRKQYAA